jgi:hypothetical protein
MKRSYSLRQKVGALFFELPSFLRCALPSNTSNQVYPWLLIRNRNEILLSDPALCGVKCDWQWTSDLHLSNVYPLVGKWLLHRILKDFPIFLAEQPHDVNIRGTPEVSILIGHRGLKRLPALLLTLKSIAAQKGCRIECIVVEQDTKKRIQRYLPGWVKYIFTPLPKKKMPYSRAWAFNAAARKAGAECLIFHDSDMLVPEVYAAHALRCHRQGYEFINLKRFIFYLGYAHTEEIFKSGVLSCRYPPETVVQNLEAGGSFVGDKNAYWMIGGFDERFIGWGGEDNEIWERAQTKKVYPYGYLPIVHLWHAPQPGIG